MKLKELWEKHKWWATPLSTAIVSVSVGAYGMYKFVAADVPDLKVQLSDYKTILQKHMDQETISLRTIRVSLLTLTQKVENRPLTKDELIELLSSIDDISHIQAKSLAKYENVIGPIVPVAKRFNDLWSLEGAKTGIPKSLLKAYEIPPPGSEVVISIDKILRHSFFAKEVDWKAVNNRLTMKYDGGSMTFVPRKDVTQADLAAQAATFNGISTATAAAIAAAVASSGAFASETNPSLK